MKALRSDKGGEFTSKEFGKFCELHGIRREYSAPYTPQQNGVAERKNRLVIEMARYMLKCKKLPNSFWAEAVLTAVYILNISPTTTLKKVTPFQAWSSIKPIVKHLRVFGSIAYTLIPSQGLQKFDAKSERCILIGYCIESKVYKLYSPISNRVIISRNVVVDESASWNWDTTDGTNKQIQSIDMHNDMSECSPADLLNCPESSISITDLFVLYATPFY